MGSQEAVTLTSTALKDLSAAVRVPQYDRAKVRCGIVHIGVGGFHRAHQAVYADDLLSDLQEYDWGILGVGLLPHDAKMRDVLKAQDGLFAVVERGETDNCRIIGSITDFILAPENPENVLQALASADTKIVSLTITESGYCWNQGTNKFQSDNADIQYDLANPTAPRTVFGYITEALDRRRKAGLKPFTILSCDNLQGNGDVARKVFLEFAKLRDAELHDWISSHVTFPNSMVDRITPQTTADDTRMVQDKFGVNDAWPVVCEPFRQWVIEDKFCNGRPSFEKVGVQMTNDVHVYEKMKIRLLNAGHSSMGYLGYLAGHQYIYEIAADSEFRTYVRNFMDQEVTPSLPAVPGIDLDEYKSTLLSRFANPNIKDQATRICMDGSGKMPKFVLPSIRDGLKNGTSIKRMCLCVASWFRFLNGTDEKGASIPLEDPMAKLLNEKALKGGANPSELLSIQELFGDLADNRAFVQEVTQALESLYKNGARATLRNYL